MGAGKTTIGKQIAKRLGWSFVDVDSFIENRYHKTISQIFAEKGEKFFREVERNVLQEVSLFEKTVISTGGGAPCFFDNMDWMNRTGITVYLKMPVSELTQRLVNCKQERPLVKGKNKEELQQFIADSLEKREVWYSRATITFPVGATLDCSIQKTVDMIAEDLIKRINKKQP